MDRSAEKDNPPRPVAPAEDRLAHLHALVDEFVAHGEQLRALHERYKAIRTEEVSDKRRAEFQQLLNSELAVLERSHRIQQEIDRFLRSESEELRARALRDTRSADDTSTTR